MSAGCQFVVPVGCVVDYYTNNYKITPGVVGGALLLVAGYIALTVQRSEDSGGSQHTEDQGDQSIESAKPYTGDTGGYQAAARAEGTAAGERIAAGKSSRGNGNHEQTAGLVRRLGPDPSDL
jgi:hypothetical protein